MKGKLTLQQRLILPVVLLGLVTLLSNILAVFSINNVHSNAGIIVDEFMVSEAKLEEIRRSMMDIHRLALSHIVAADHATMIQLVQEIKGEEADLDEMLAAYEPFVTGDDSMTYRSLLEDYKAFKHALVYLVCASADSKTQEAYATANGDVATWSDAVEEDIDALYASVSSQATAAQSHFSVVYIISLITSAVTLTVGILLVAAAPDHPGICNCPCPQCNGNASGQLRTHQRGCGGSPPADPHFQQQCPEPFQPDRASLRPSGRNRQQHHCNQHQRRRYPERCPKHGGRMFRYYRLFSRYAGTCRRNGTVGPGRNGNCPWENRRNYVGIEPGHRKE